MPNDWYYLPRGIANEQVGPVEERELSLLLGSGQLRAATKVMSPTETGGRWHQVGAIPSLMKIISDAEQSRAADGRMVHAGQSLPNEADKDGPFAELLDTPPAVAEAIKSAARAILTRDEEVVYAAVQQNMLGLNFRPDAAIATNRRLILLRRKLLGGYDFDDYFWRDLHDAHLSHGTFSGTFTAQHVSGRMISMTSLSRKGSQQLYRLAQEAEEVAHHYRRERDLETRRAGAAQINIANQPVQQRVEGNPAPEPPVREIPRTEKDPVDRLSKLKELLDSGLITTEDFDKRKADILSDI